MSTLTLQIVKRCPSEMGHIFESCDMGCGDLAYGGKRSAIHEALILGQHAAWLCQSCANTWADTWTSASGQEPTRRWRRNTTTRRVEAEQDLALA
jgi:hypothetical protein